MTEATQVSGSAPASERAGVQRTRATVESGESLAHRVVQLYGRLDIPARTALLSRLLGSLGPLALAVVGKGIFAKYVRHARGKAIPVSAADVVGATPGVIAELVRYVRQSNPREIERLLLKHALCP